MSGPDPADMKLAAVVLAAGSATRFGGDKLSAAFAGKPLVHHAICAAQAAPVEQVIVVAHPSLMRGTLAKPISGVRMLSFPSQALSQSLRVGVAAAGDVDGVFVFLGDMPLVPHRAAARLAALIGDNYAAMPTYAGKPGHPVLLSRRALGDLAELEGDSGFGKLLRGRTDVVFDACQDPLIHADIDRPEDLDRLPGEERHKH